MKEGQIVQIMEIIVMYVLKETLKGPLLELMDLLLNVQIDQMMV